MWKLSNSFLPEKKKTKQVEGLELLELGNTSYKGTLAKVNYAVSFAPSENSPTSSGSEGKEVVLSNLEPSLLLNSNLYVLDRLWDFSSFIEVKNPHFLDEGTYYKQDGKTYLLSQTQSTTTAEAEFFYVLEEIGTDYSFTLNLEGYNIDTITKVEVEGLSFSSSLSEPLNFTYTDNTLILNTVPYCHPKEGELAKITTSRTYNLTTERTLDCLIFDISSINLDFVTYFSYQNSSFVSNSTFQSGTLIQNFTQEKILCLS